MYIYMIHTATRPTILRGSKKYQRVSISFDQELSEVYSFGRKLKSRPFSHGVMKENLSMGKLADAPCLIYRMNVSEEEYHQMQKLLEDDERRQLLNYTLLESILLPWGIGKNQVKHSFSSEFVATLLKKGASIQLPKSVTSMTPQDMRNLPEMTFVFEGLLSSYIELNELAKLGYPLDWDNPTLAY